MNWKNVRLILAREIRDQLRDRRTLFVIAVLPLLLYPLLGMAFFQIAQFMREHPSQVLVLGLPDISKVSDLPPLFEDGHFATELYVTPRESRLLELTFGSLAGTGGEQAPPNASEAAEDGLSSIDVSAAKELVQEGTFQVLVYFPPRFGKRLQQLKNTLLKHRSRSTSDGAEPTPKIDNLIQPHIYHNTASEKSQIAYTRVSRVLLRWRESVVEEYFEQLRVPNVVTKPFEFETEDLAEQGHRDAAVWSKVLPFVLLIWALTGAFYPAIDVCAGEKERGTLETLLSSPAERSEIVWGKLLTIMIFSVVTSALNLLSMAVTGAFIIDQVNRLPGMTEAASLTAPSLGFAVWLFLALLPVAALFSALCLALAAFARSTKEGQYYLMPLLLIIMPLMILPMAPGVELTLGNSLVPVTGVVLLLRALLEGNTVDALLFSPLVICVTFFCCLLAIRWAVDQFNSESVLFRESERLELGLWMKHLVRDRRATPTVGEAVFCFVLILLIQFFLNLALPAPRLDAFSDLALRIVISLVVMIALPAMLMTILLTRRPAETLLLHQRPSVASLLLAILLALAMHPVSHGLQAVIQRLYPVTDAVAAHTEMLVSLFERAPNPWLPLLLVAVLPAICEEIAFRGFILSGLRHLGHKWWAIVLSAAFFGLAHGVLQQSIMASLLGIVLGLLAVQTGSLIPCVAFHIVHNGVMLATAQITVHAQWFTRYPWLQAFLDASADGQPGLHYRWTSVVICAIIAAAILRRLYRLPYQPTEEERFQDALEHQTAGSLDNADPMDSPT